MEEEALIRFHAAASEKWVRLWTTCDNHFTLGSRMIPVVELELSYDDVWSQAWEELAYGARQHAVQCDLPVRWPEWAAE